MKIKLQDIAIIRTNFKEADFWLIRKGSIKKVGFPVKEFQPQHIGIKIIDTHLYNPDFMYWFMMHVHCRNYWTCMARGTLKLQHIVVKDVQQLQFQQL